jgi:hypothetical protein
VYIYIDKCLSYGQPIEPVKRRNPSAENLPPKVGLFWV